MRWQELRQEVWQANRQIVDSGLVVLTWGNASGIDRTEGVLLIKPSGVSYDELRPEHLVAVDLASGEVVEGDLKPSSDTPTHRCLYQAFPELGGIVHTHSRHATAWAQAGCEVPCLGTTHADHFYGPVPVTRPLTKLEIEADYEWNTGEVMVERFQEGGLHPLEVPAALVCGHGPFTWGTAALMAAQNAIVLEEVCQMVEISQALNPQVRAIDQALLDKHFKRKHGPGAYYGQKS